MSPSLPQTGQMCLVSDTLDGEFRFAEEHPILAKEEAALYGDRIINDKDGNNVYLGWNLGAQEGVSNEYSYSLSKPHIVTCEE